MKRLFLLACTCLLLSACTQTNPASFYFWKTTYRLSPLEKQYLEEMNTQQLYVRFFDIDIADGKAIPVAEISIQEKNNIQHIIPVVFITNEVFQHLDKKATEILAKHTVNEIDFLYKNISGKSLQEIQLDCDWTMSTKNTYFYFITQLKKLRPQLLFSATIRLHQIKYKGKTGIPPLQKAVLMYYATENPLKEGAQNSILENEEAKAYIQDLKQYPIPLDIALPIYSWAIIENELGDKRLLNGIRKEDLMNKDNYQQLSHPTYLVKRDHYLKGTYLYEDYKIKTEEISVQQLNRATKDIRKHIKNKSFTTIFFQLDSSNLVHYSVDELKKLSN